MDLTPATEVVEPTPPEKENKPNFAHPQAEQQKALAGVIARIRESLDLETIFKTTATEVRQLLKADRVGVFRFYPEMDWEGEFVAEDVAEGWISAMAARVHDRCFSEKYASLYMEGWVNAIADLQQVEYDQCYLEILEKFQVRANIVAPLIKGRTLWGLLCIHQCSGPRYWSESEVEFAKQIADQLGVALQHSELLIQARLQAEQQKMLFRVIARIRETLDLETIFQTTATEVRQLLKADRAGVLRLCPDRDWEGEFISEDVAEGWTSTLTTRVHDHCFSEKFALLYTQGRVNAIADVYQNELSPCYIEILERFQIRANITAPILNGKKLWGLLCIHQCSHSRRWESYEVEFVNHIAEHLGVAVQQAESIEQVQAQAIQLGEAAERERTAERDRALAITIDKIRQSLDLEIIFHTTTQEVRQLLNADRVAIYQFNSDWTGQFVVESVAEGWNSLIQQQIEDPELRQNISECSVRYLVNSHTSDTHLQETEGSSFSRGETFRVCDDIYSAGFTDCYIQALESYQARAYIVVAIFLNQTLWGLIAAYQNTDARHWQPDEICLLTQIATQLGIALKQAEYVKQVQTQAAQLAKAAERQRALATTVEKIRQSLDINTIFQMTTQEVRQLLEVERVAIYRFFSNWSGEFVADSIVDGWTPIVNPQPVTPNVFLSNTKEGLYPRNETFVPILQGEKLWGLLVAYQSSQPRYWQDEEINLLAQVGVQLGIAIQQAELLDQTRRQAEELTKALKELQQSQAQLIQKEKMAGLGQMIAGIAHEINNPVNFIFGNLPHISKYTQRLLSLVNLYEKYYPESVAEIQEQVQAIDLDFMNKDLPKTLASMKLGTDRIREIVLSLRIFSRLDEAKMKSVNIHDGIESTLLILQHRIKANAIRPKIEIIKEYSELPLVECYPAQLNQVFMNVLTNAIDALEKGTGVPEMKEQDCKQADTSHPPTPYPLAFIPSSSSPTIWIRTEILEGDRMAIRITDNGCGIPEHVRSRIFDPFFTTKPIGQGTGLGLSISYQIVVEKHKGQLKCISQPSQGAEFSIEIPIRRSN